MKWEIEKHPITILTSALLLELVIVFILIPKTYIIQVGQYEEQALMSQLGQPTLEYVDTTAKEWFQQAFVDTKVLWTSYNMLFPLEQSGFGDGVDSWARSRFDTLWLTVYQAVFRLASFVIWLPYFVPLLVPCIVDGLLEREIRKYQFSLPSVFAHHGAYQFMIKLALGTIILPFAPFSTPPVVYPIAMGLLCLSVWIFFANLQKRT